MSQQPDKFEGTSLNITDEQKAKLKSLFPEIITEGGKVDFDRLRLTLGDATVDTGKERYGMNWPGKADCFKTIQQPSMATLVPARSESVNFDTTENLIIEGDNLEVLKLLQKAYLGKVKMIYIDPPYNTGNDFIYPDDYSESLDTYLRYTGQVDNEGRKFSTNTEADGRFHSKWMNMMYPRLFHARNLLTHDGVLFLSIGEDELTNVEKICNEVFGEENRISIIPRVAKTASDAGTFFAPSMDYILCYSKDISSTSGFSDKVKEELFKKIEKDGPRAGERYRDDVALYQSSLTLERSKNARYFIECPDGSLCIPPEGKRWRIVEASFLELKAKNMIVFKSTSTSPLLDANGNKSKWNLYTKSYLKDREEKGARPRNFIDNCINRKGADLIKKYGINFDFSKPVELMGFLLDIVNPNSGDIILDFFAGSGSTAHSVLLKNRKDNSQLRFILIQLPEILDEETRKLNPGLDTVSDICKERIRRVSKEIEDDKQGKLAYPDSKEDLGFKVFKLQSSNFKAWNPEQVKDQAELTKQLSLHVDHLVEGRSQEDVLYELLLKSGFPLDTPIEKLTLANKTVFSIGDGLMLVCLEHDLTLEVLRAMADKKPERVVCLDAGFANNDQLKTNAVQTMKAKGVTKFQTV